MDKIAVLIPCYNEALSISKVIADFKQALPEAIIYVYDNNSSDGTAELALKAGAIVRHEYQQGKGNVIRRMFREIDAKCYIMVDGDDTYPAEYAAKLAEPVLERQCDMVVGDRLSSTYFEENKRPFHNFGNVLVRKLVNTIFRSDIRDIMTGYRAFSYRFVKTFPVISKGFEIETEMSIHTVINNFRIENLIINYRDRAEGSESKLNTYSDGLKVLRTILRLFRIYRPALFYGLISCLLILASLLAGKWLFALAIIALFTGMILDAIQYKDRQKFESQLIYAQDRFNDLCDR
ncbi:MAG: glycosyltransferase [Erysipelotrichaceae bacterium]|nr:glycosyltransferase [Erysipelotrichaceae bacterium]